MCPLINKANVLLLQCGNNRYIKSAMVGAESTDCACVVSRSMPPLLWVASIIRPACCAASLALASRMICVKSTVRTLTSTVLLSLYMRGLRIRAAHLSVSMRVRTCCALSLSTSSRQASCKACSKSASALASRAASHWIRNAGVCSAWILRFERLIPYSANIGFMSSPAARRAHISGNAASTRDRTSSVMLPV